MKLRNHTLGLIAALAMGAGASSSAVAALTLGVGAGGVAGDQILGEVIPSDMSQPGLAARDQLMINTLVGMSPGARTSSGINPEYYRSTTSFGPLPNATLTDAWLKGGIGDMTPSGLNYISVQLPSTTTYQYLVGAYDGPNGGAEVWYIGNVVAGTEILIPRYAHPSPESTGNGGSSGLNDWPQNLVAGTSYQITTWTAFNPTPVPEPTTMVAGALLLLPFAGSTVRLMRKNRKA